MPQRGRRERHARGKEGRGRRQLERQRPLDNVDRAELFALLASLFGALLVVHIGRARHDTLAPAQDPARGVAPVGEPGSGGGCAREEEEGDGETEGNVEVLRDGLVPCTYDSVSGTILERKEPRRKSGCAQVVWSATAAFLAAAAAAAAAPPSALVTLAAAVTIAARSTSLTARSARTTWRAKRAESDMARGAWAEGNE